MVANWRKAIYVQARSPWFVLLSDDDYLIDNTYLARAWALIQQHQPRFVYAGGFVNDLLSGTSVRLTLPFKGLVEGHQVFRSRGTVAPQDIILASLLFRVADARRLGFLCDPYNLSCDSELYLSLCVEGDAVAMPEPVCVYTKHGDNNVRRVMRSRRLLDRNLDHLVKPYHRARQAGICQSGLAEFRRNSRLDASIGHTLRLLRLHNEAWYRECKERLNTMVPDLVDEVERIPAYRLWRGLYSLFRTHFQAKYPLVDEGVEAL